VIAIASTVSIERAAELGALLTGLDEAKYLESRGDTSAIEKILKGLEKF